MNGVVGETMTLHIIDSDLYFDIEFTSYSGGNSGGGFSYIRTWVPVGCDEVLLVEGCVDDWACKYDASATYKISQKIFKYFQTYFEIWMATA